MMYTIATQKSVYGEVIDRITTTDKENIYIVKRKDKFKLRRTFSDDITFIWDLSDNTYNTLEEAEKALLSGNVIFRLADIANTN